jgi:CheY-like chemotaxis protein
MLGQQEKYNMPLHLILIFVLLVIGIITSGYLLYAIQKAEFKKRENNNLAVIADMKVREIVNWRKEKLWDAHVVQQNTPAIHRVRQFLENPSSVEISQEILSNIEGLEFIGQAANANDAVEGILKLKSDVVILDIRLNGGENGMNVLERIKKEQSPPVVIMLTNYPYPQYRKKCRELGAEYFFDKVTEIESFVKVLRTLAQDISSKRPDRAGRDN